MRTFARGLLSVVVALGASGGCDDKKTNGAAAPPSASVATAVSAPPPASAPAVAAPSASAPAAPPTAVAAQHVLIAYRGAKGAPAGVKRSKADAKTRAEEVLAKARSGSDFSALALEYSDDPGAKERRGSVGKFTRDKMTKPFSDAAFALQVGEISGVVATPFGFHVIKRNQ